MSGPHLGDYAQPLGSDPSLPIGASIGIDDANVARHPREPCFSGTVPCSDPLANPPLSRREDDTFVPRQSWTESSPSHQVYAPHRSHPPSSHHHRPQHHPYAGFEHKPAQLVHPTAHSVVVQPTPIAAYPLQPSGIAQGSATFSDSDPHGTRQVSRAACLSCRSAKRKCDGVKPVCGPCAQRGIQDDPAHTDGACVYVASKRGGPRFKGVRGKEATRKVLDERERFRIEEDERTFKDKDKDKDTRLVAFSPEAAADRRPPGDGSHGSTSFPSDPHATNLNRCSSQTSSYNTPDRQISPAFSRKSSDFTGPVSPHTPMTPALARSELDVVSASEHSPSVFAFGHQREALFQSNYFRPMSSSEGGLFDDLSAANLEMWQKLQGPQLSPVTTFADFYQKLEDLPKAGVLTRMEVDEPIIDDFDANSAFVDVSEAARSAAAVNSEQQARSLLTDYYKLVYPGCPVMLPSGHLSSLAFHLSEDDSSALLAAISSCVALQLPQSDVHRIVRGSMHLSDPDDAEANDGLRALENAPREEIALFHAKSAERLLLKKVAQLARGNDAVPLDSRKATFGIHQTGLSSAFVTDLELVRIKLVATHVLLSHYYYGASEQKRAFHHASQAWTHCQALNLDASVPSSSAPSWFSFKQKSEWARRAYWCSYTAATVMSCTGGFTPLTITRNSAAHLSLLPGDGRELASWRVLAKGAQFVSRAYGTLYELDAFKNDLTHVVREGQPQLRQHQQKWEGIFSRMQDVDNDVMNYTRHDPVWRDEECFETTVTPARQTFHVDNADDTRLQRSLRIAGKLMTSGALIILHRTQAFGNARIFFASTCGIPGACDDSSDGPSSSDSALSRTAALAPAAASDVGPPTVSGKGHDAAPNKGQARLDKQRGHGEVDCDRATKRPRTRRPRNLSIGSRSSSSSDSGGTSSASNSSTLNLKTVPLTTCGIPVHFAGGPFDPAISLERCRFAASIMYVELVHVCRCTVQHGQRDNLKMLPVEGLGVGTPASLMSREEWSAPCLPPFSACSLVLAAYVFLMETLHAQIASGGSHFADPQGSDLVDEGKSLELPFLQNCDPNRPRQIPRVEGKEAFRMAMRLQQCIVEIEHALQKFARAWDISKSYVQEVNVLLEVNNGLFYRPSSA